MGDGFPLASPWEVLLVTLLIGTLVFTAQHSVKQGRWLALILLALALAGFKLVLFQFQLPHGLIGRYRVEPQGIGQKWERSLHHSIPDATRLDGTLAFHNTAYRWGSKPFPFFFLNDKRRHPWVGSVSTVQPTVHVQWDGYLAVEEPGAIAFRLDTPDSCGLTLDGRDLIPAGKGEEHCGQEVPVELEAGLHEIRVTYSQHIASLNAPPAQSRLSLQWRRGGESWETVPTDALLPFQPKAESLEQDRRMKPLAQGLFLFQLLLLAAGFGVLINAPPLASWKGERGKLACWALLLIGLGLVMTMRDARNPSSNYIWLGYDPSAYVAESRAYITESWIAIPSEGHEGKVVYNYFLAVAQLVFGESLLQIILIQRFLLVAVACLIYWVGRSFFSPRAGMYAMLLTGVSTHMLGWSRALFPATLAALLLALTVACALHARRSSSNLWMLGAGVTLGLSIHTRPNFLPLIVVVLAWLALTQRPWRRSLASIGTFALGSGLIELLARLRALAAYGTLSITQNMVSINLSRGNPIPAGVDLSAVPQSTPLGLPKHLWAMWAFATQQPLEFASRWGKKLLYLFGVNIWSYANNHRVFTYEIFFFTAAALLGAALARKRYGRRATLMPLALVAANGAVLVVTSPDLHAHRLLMPLLPLLAIYVGVVLETLDLSWPLRASWKANLLRTALFFALMPFRYGIQYAFLGAAYLLPSHREKRPPSSAIVEELFRKPRDTSPLTTKGGSLK